MNELRLSANIQTAINAKLQATQEALRSEAMLRKNLADAASAVAVAKGQADAKIAAAQGDARALETVGEAIKKYGAEAAQLKNQTLWIEKWNGQLPTNSSGANTMVMIGVGK